MLRKKIIGIVLKYVLSVALICIGFLWINTAKVLGSDCDHEVYCDDMTTCIICGKENLEETEITNVVHPFSYCYDLSTCGICEQPIAESSAEEVRHTFEEQAKFYCDGKFHTAVCYCGEVSETQKHIVKCTQDDICFLCGGDATDPQKIIKHMDEHLYQDADYHWKECKACNQLTLPKFEHFTDCIDADGPCGLCRRSHDDCNFLEEKVGMHKLIHEIVGEGEERHHVDTCLICNNVIKDHQGIIYKDFGSDDVHAVRCAECSYGFNDEEHIYKNGTCMICGHKKQSPPVPVTGDESHILSWILILSGALACMFFCLVKTRKLRKK